MRNYVVYTSRSCDTGKRIFEHLRSTEGRKWKRKNKRKGYAEDTSVIIRHGAIDHPVTEGVREINGREAVATAAIKKRMVEALRSGDSPVVPFITRAEGEGDKRLELQQWYNDFGSVFVRRKNGVVEYSTEMRNDDQYYMLPINKQREFRVHVACGKTMGVYEKVPKDGMDATIRKNHNCDFKRLDQSNEELMSAIKGVRPAAIQATKDIGLDYSGVDVMIDDSGKVWVNEVNSAPGLSDKNIARLVAILKENELI